MERVLSFPETRTSVGGTWRSGIDTANVRDNRKRPGTQRGLDIR